MKMYYPKKTRSAKPQSFSKKMVNFKIDIGKMPIANCSYGPEKIVLNHKTSCAI